MWRGGKGFQYFVRVGRGVLASPASGHEKRLVLFSTLQEGERGVIGLR
jgi:hypothetical protein